MLNKREKDRPSLFSRPLCPALVGAFFFLALFFAPVISRSGESPAGNPNIGSTENLSSPSGSIAVDTLFSVPDTAYFSLVRLRFCDTITLPMTNNSPDPIVVDSVRFVSSSSSLFLIDLFPNPVAIGVGLKESVRIGFCPTDTLCHNARLIIYAHSVAAPETMILHTVGIQGCGGTPLIGMDRLEIDFGSVTVSTCLQQEFVLRNDGNYPLRIAGISVPNSDFHIVDPSRFPITLPPYSIRKVIVEFCPSSVGLMVNTIAFDVDADNPTPKFLLEGTGTIYHLSLPTPFDVGSVPLGRCIDTFIVVTNQGSVPITLTQVRLAELPLPNDFVLLTQIPTGESRILLPGDTFRIAVRFCPTVQGKGSRLLQVIDDGGDVAETLMEGEGVLPLIWLDTAAVNAGEIATLHFRIGPGDPTGPGTYRAELQFDPDALFPTGVDAPDGSVGITSRSKGQVVVEGKRSAPLPADGTLFRIAFRGLATGQPVNNVKIGSVGFTPPIGQLETRDGIVLLSGCDVGNLPGVAKRAHIAALGPNPAEESVLLTYQAPHGRSPLLTVFDYLGNRMIELTLPEGTGETQEFRLDLKGLPGGLYLIELRERDERSLRTLLID